MSTGWYRAIGLLALIGGALQIGGGIMDELAGERSEATLRFTYATAMLCWWILCLQVFERKD